jgi:hypothetical protein
VTSRKAHCAIMQRRAEGQRSRHGPGYPGTRLAVACAAVGDGSVSVSLLGRGLGIEGSQHSTGIPPQHGCASQSESAALAPGSRFTLPLDGPCTYTARSPLSQDSIPGPRPAQCGARARAWAWAWAWAWAFCRLERSGATQCGAWWAAHQHGSMAAWQ